MVYSSIPQGESDAHIYTYDVEVETMPRQLTFDGNNITPVVLPDGNRVVFSSQREGTDGTEPTPRVLSRNSLFTANYYAPASDLHPAGNQVIVGRIGVATQEDDAASEPEQFMVVTNRFEELRQRMGGN